MSFPSAFTSTSRPGSSTRAPGQKHISYDSSKREDVTAAEDADVDSNAEQVPVHLFLSPSHGSSNRRPSSSSSNETQTQKKYKETAFVELPDDSDREELSSACVSPLTISSGPTSPVNRTRNLRRTNKISDAGSIGPRTQFPHDRAGSATSVSDTDHVSEHLSYKDRLREHINTIRDKAVESMSRPASRSQSRMKLLMASRPSRAEDAMKREEREVAMALERHQKLRGQWRQLSDEILRRKSEKEGYEFFIEEKDAEIEELSGPMEVPTSPALTDKSREGKIAVADCLDLKPEWEPIFWLPAKLATGVAKIWEFIFYPSSKQAPLNEKLEEGLNPRFMEEEGLYVENQRKRPPRMKSKLENRLLKVPGGRKWFGPDGELLGKPQKSVFNLEINFTLPKGVYYRYPTLPTFQKNLDNNHVVLDLELLAVRFSHHWLFSREHLLAQRLKELFRRYRQFRHTDSCRRLKGQLDALRRARDSAKNDGFDVDIKEVRNKWLAESKIEKLIETRLLATWRDIQRLREEQGYRNTSVQINVTHKPGVSVEEWENELACEVAEAQAEAQRDYQAQKSKYDDEYENWRKSMSGQDEEENYEEIKECLPPPDPIPAPDLSAIEQTVRETFRSSLKSPGDAVVDMVLGDLGPPTATSDVREEARRSAVKKEKLSVKLTCNGKEVYKSDDHYLSASFTVKFGQRFAVRLLEWPKSLTLELTQSNRVSCVVFLPFPDCMTTIERVDVTNFEFSSAAVVTCNHAGVGCGREITPYSNGSEFNSKQECLFTSGSLACRLGWAVDSSGRLLSPPSHFWNQREKALRDSNIRSHSEVAKLKEWVEKARLDPHDPSNAQLFQVLGHNNSITIETSAVDNDLDFCDAAELENNPRLRLLRLRDQGEPEFRGFLMVPLSEKLIHPDIFKAYEARVARPIEQETLVDPLDCHRAVGRRRLDQIRQSVLQKCRQARQHRRLADVVCEDQVPDLGTLGLTLMRWLRPKRPLRPERKQRKKVPVQTIIGQGVSIVVNVVRAFEVPVRKDMDSLSATGSIDGFSLVNVRPFVSATFRGESARTTAAEGANPTWNQDLVLPVHTSTGEFSPGALAGMKETLFLHLFDEVVVDLVEEDALRDTTIHQRMEKHWLAGLEIPFSTLYINSRVEGTFQLYSPPVLLGYEREAHRVAGGSLPQRDATYLTVFITVQPALNPPEPFLDVFAANESPQLEAHLRGWQSEFHSLFPNRIVYPLVSTSSATAVCITRLIRSIPPPVLPALGENPATAAAVARFVARIPTVSSATFFPGLLDVWLTCDQVIEMLSGDAEDHAVILCCFLLHIGQPAYLLMGVGIPHGASAYVLINSPGSEVIWDPTSGCKYSVRDSFCPLQKVYCLVNNANIWANIQDDDAPRRVRFDTTKRADWLPAFNKNMSPPEDSIQPESLTFKETSKLAVQALQDKLENRLRDGMMKWRRRQRTQWNRYCAATMRKLLPRLEEATWGIGDPASPDHWIRLNHILASHKVCGFPINLPYTDIDAVLEAVKATGVHSTDSEDVEFALAVHIYPYPGNVLSVWVYVASLTRRR